MIVGKNRGITWAYIAIPRTGSNSMIHWLRQNYGGQQHGHHHSWKFPSTFPIGANLKRGVLTKAPCIFTIVRHPYYRAISLYRNFIRTGAPKNHQPWWKVKTFTEYLKRLIELATVIEPNAYIVPEWMVNQVQYCILGQVNLVIHHERIALSGVQSNELKKLHFVDPEKIPLMDHLNKTPDQYAPFTVNDITDKEEKLIYEWAEPDFRTFNYDRFLKGK